MGSRLIRTAPRIVSASLFRSCTRSISCCSFPPSAKVLQHRQIRWIIQTHSRDAKEARAQSSRHPKTVEVIEKECLPAVDGCLAELRELLSHDTPPEDDALVATLKRCQDVALEFRSVLSPDREAANSRSRSSAGKLLELDEAKAASSSMREAQAEQLSQTLYDFVKEPKVFLSPRVLQLYVQVQSTLHRPETFPEVFDLYANKPVPLRGTSPIRFKRIRPGRIASAIPSETASQALDSAIEARILPLCLDVIASSVCTPAYRRRKIIQKMWIPGAVIALTPPAAWLIAQQFDAWQITLTSRYARTLAFTGFASYVGFTAVLGYVALTTANDQMQRVTWRDGLPLTTRWLREDERALIDRIALSWGFKDKHRWGEEESPEWDALKELVSIRDMVLDRVELMEGME